MMLRERGTQTASRIRWVVVLGCVFGGSLAWSADKVTGMLLAKDAVTGLNRSAVVEAKLIRRGLAGDVGLGGEPLELVHNGQVIAKTMTGGDGRALFQFTPKARGMVTLTVRVGDNPRVTAAESMTNVASWEQRTPILAVEVAALMDESESSSVMPSLVPPDKRRKPLPDAADELSKLTQFYYNLLYIAVAEHDPSGGFSTNDRIRTWLKEHKFPLGHILVLPTSTDALGLKLDEFHAAGWKTLKVGIGRSRAFAEAFLERRLDVVIVPEPAQGEVPRKAKLAKGWKEVRKKL